MLKHRNFLQKWHAKNAEGNPLRNPLFPHRSATAKRNVLAGVIATASLLLIVLGVMMYGPWLRITSVIVEGLTTIPSEQVIARIDVNMQLWKLHLFPENTLMLFDRNQLAVDLVRDFQFKVVETKYDGRKLIVHVEESVLEVALQADGKMYFLKRDGMISREAEPEQVLAATVPLVLLTEHNEGEELAIDEAALANIIAIDEGLRKMGITPKHHTLARLADSWITTTTDTSLAIMIDVTKSVENQLNTLSSVLAERGGLTYEYVDVRFGEHVFVKEL